MTDSPWTFAAIAERQLQALDAGAGGSTIPTDSTSLARRILAATEHGLRREQALLHAKYGNPNDDDRLAVAVLLQNAKKGSDECQLQLGTRYGVGDGVPKDAREAFRWYRAAAQPPAEHPDALLLMASSLLAGAGAERDDALAVQSLRSSADQGVDCARLLLAACLAEGRGIAQNRDEAARMFKLASGGDARAAGSSRSKAIAECLREGAQSASRPAASLKNASTSDPSSESNYRALKERVNRGELCYYCMKKPPTKMALHAADGARLPACDACFQMQVDLGKARQRWSLGCLAVAGAVVALAVSKCSS